MHQWKAAACFDSAKHVIPIFWFKCVFPTRKENVVDSIDEWSEMYSLEATNERRKKGAG